MPLEHLQYRQLTEADLLPKAEFTLTRPSFATKNDDSQFPLRIGDVIKIHRVAEDGIYISVNGHFQSSGDQLFIPLDEVGNLSVDEE